MNVDLLRFLMSLSLSPPNLLVSMSSCKLSLAHKISAKLQVEYVEPVHVD
jgi:hypothetical protein